MKFVPGKMISSKALKYFTYLIILIGIALRICVYLQNRDLFLDEANVARNIYERDFCGLLRPLSYQQYAPPLFLWALKLVTEIGGYSEYAFRLVPLLCSIGSLGLLYLLLVRFGVKKVAWYPLFLFSTGLIYLRYATELKQYSSDCFIALALIWLALKIDVGNVTRWRFVLQWVLIGSIAIWASMPSVFVLAGIGCYYMAVVYTSAQRKRCLVLIPVFAVWIFQFLLYYLLILRFQISNDGLQSYHSVGFLYPIPHTMHQLSHDWLMIVNIVEIAAGYWFLSILFHGVMILVGMYSLIRKKMLTSLLLFTPILLLLLAAALHQYAIVPRLILFILPVILMLVAIGFEQVIEFQYLSVLLIGVSIVCLFNFNELQYFSQPLRVQQLRDSMGFLRRGNVVASQLYVHSIAYPVYDYYTEINPRKEEWAQMKNAKQLHDPVNYDSLATTMPEGSAILYGYIDPKELALQQRQINSHFKISSQYGTLYSHAYIYTKP